jgi:hypothetical protein
MLYMSLYRIREDLDLLLGDWEGGDSTVREDMPAIVRTQPHAWWEQTYNSADRLFEAARSGAIDDLVPRTPAEEALLALAARDDYVGWAKDTARDLGTQVIYDRLPEDAEWDGEYGEMLPSLRVLEPYAVRRPTTAYENPPRTARFGPGTPRVVDRAIR